MLPHDEPTGSDTLRSRDDDEQNDEEVRMIRLLRYDTIAVKKRTRAEVLVLLDQQPDNQRRHLNLDLSADNDELCGIAREDVEVSDQHLYEEIEVNTCRENEVELHAMKEREVDEEDKTDVTSKQTDEIVCDMIDSSNVTSECAESTIGTTALSTERNEFSKSFAKTTCIDTTDNNEDKVSSPEQLCDENYPIVELPDSPILGRTRNSHRRSKTQSSNKVKILAIYPRPPAKSGISINTEDWKCLRENEFLNDVIIDFYLKYLHNEILSSNDKRRTHIFSSHFFSRLMKSSNVVSNDDNDDNANNAQNDAARLRHAGVERWTKNVNIFEKDFIVVPINENAHWYLAIICFPYLVSIVGQQHKDCIDAGIELRKPCIIIFDSLCETSKAKVAATLRDYLYYEHIAKRRHELKFTFSQIKTVYAKVPRQSNDTDCGLFVLQYVESFFTNPIKDYTLPFKDLSRWFDKCEITRKRGKVADIITGLAMEHGTYDKIKEISLNSSPTSPMNSSLNVTPPISSKCSVSTPSTTMNSIDDDGDNDDDYKLKFTSKTYVARPTRLRNNQGRTAAMLDLAKNRLKRKNKNEWVSKPTANASKTSQFDKSIFTRSPNTFSESYDSNDKFYNLSYGALKNERGISPSMSYKSFKIKKLSERSEE